VTKPPTFDRVGVRALAALTCGVAYAMAGHAQSFPTKPLLLVLPTAPGGPVDIVARIVAPEASKLLGQPIVMENRPGASQKIGIHSMLRAPRDGYTLAVISPASATINPLVDRSVGYDPLKDFTLLSQAVGHAAVVTVHPSVPVRTLQELVAYARANPGRLTYGSGGNGTSLHFSTSELLMKLGITAVHVPYKSDGPAFNDLLGGQISLMIPAVATVKSALEAGRLVPLAISGTSRAPQLPNVPTYGETGIAELKDYSYRIWIGFAAGAGIPEEAATKLQDALRRAPRAPAARQSLEATDFEIIASSPQEFARELRAELERNRRVIASGAIKVE
jgi:tripartite-type tricarboxylate transporter receptor subunit TctC